MVGVHVVSPCFAGIVFVLYRPGSAAVQQSFFDELATILDRVATYQEPTYVIGDFNIRLDRVDDPHAAQFRLYSSVTSALLYTTGARCCDALVAWDARR